jgi:hypothetical protein
MDLAIPMFDPEDNVVADVFPFPPTRSAEAPPRISAGLNSADLSFVYLDIQPAGEALLAREGSGGMHITDSIWLDLRPAEALLLAERLRLCAEAAARFAEAFPEDIADVPEADDGALDA